MPNRLKTMKVQNEPDQIGKLRNNEDALPVLPGSEEVSNLPANHHLTEKANCPLSPDVTTQNSWDGAEDGAPGGFYRTPHVCLSSRGC